MAGHDCAAGPFCVRLRTREMDMHTDNPKQPRHTTGQDDIHTIWMILAATAATACIMLWMLQK
jgi:tryptophan-rich sensory protein